MPDVGLSARQAFRGDIVKRVACALAWRELSLALLCVALLTHTPHAASKVIAVPVEQTDRLALVSPAPQDPITTPSFRGSLLLRAPLQYWQRLGPPPPSSGTSTMRAAMGSAFGSTLPHQRVEREEGTAVLKPDWLAGRTEHRSPAYALYRLSAKDFSGLSTIGLSWSHLPAATGSANYIGIANWQTNCWNWFQGELDDVITLAGLEPFISIQDEVLVLVLVVGTEPHVLSSISLGAHETRGVGNQDAAGASRNTMPPLYSPGLPAKVDLSSMCAPIRHQGDWGACTAFALGDGAVNYEMRRVYGHHGWNFSNASQKASPAYLYVESGKAHNPPQACAVNADRTYPQVVQWLKANGIALEKDAPYLPSPCQVEMWRKRSAGDAVLLRPVRADGVACTTQSGLTQMKTFLAQGFVLPFGTYVDQAFHDWTAGSPPWKYGGEALFGHAMCIVGYDDAKQAFRVRNSWGVQWGDKGYADVAYASLQDTAAGAECYIIELAEDQEVVKQLLGSSEGVLLAPADVTASAGTYPDKVRIDWETVPEAETYRVYRDFTTTLLAEVSAPVAHWNDKTCDDAFSHTYWVKAVKDGYESTLSASATGYAANAAAPPVIYGLYYDDGRAEEQTQFSLDYYSSTPVTFEWSMAGCDPAASDSDAPVARFVTPGLQPISVTVANATGSATLTGNIHIADPATPPGAVITASPSSGPGPLTVLLDASDSTEDSAIARYEWDLDGDGIYEQDTGLASIILATLQRGEWQVSVRVWDDDGHSDVAAIGVSVR